MNENSLKKFFKDKSALKHFPADGERHYQDNCGNHDNSGLAKNVSRVILVEN